MILVKARLVKCYSIYKFTKVYLIFTLSLVSVDSVSARQAEIEFLFDGLDVNQIDYLYEATLNERMFIL